MPKVGTKGAPIPRARLSKGGWEPNMGAEARVGSGNGLGSGPGREEELQGLWKSRSGSGGQPRRPMALCYRLPRRREERHRGPARPGSEDFSCPPGPPSRVRGPRRLRSPSSSSRLPGPGASPQAAAWNAGGGLPSPRPRRLLPSSRLARGGRHRPSRGRRAKWRRSDRLARRRRAREPRSATPLGPRPPKRPLQTPPPPARGAVPCGARSGRGTAACCGLPTTTRKGERKKRAAAISHPRPALAPAPASASAQPAALF